MKVPVYDAPQAKPGELPVAADNLNASGLGSGVSQGLQQLGAAADDAAAMYRHEKEKADAANVTDALAAQQDKINREFYDKQNGLMFKRGDDVFPVGGDKDAGQQALDNISMSRDDIADKMLTNEAQRELFRARSNAMLEQASREAMVHVGQQAQVAQKASVEGLKATSLDALAANYANPKARAHLMAQPEGSIKALALSPEDGAADLADWRAKASSTVLNQYIASKDWKGAEAYFAQAKGQLGTKSAQFEHTIQTLKEQRMADDMAIGIMNTNRQASGFVDYTAAIRQYEQLPPDKRNEQADAAFHKFLGLEAEAEQKQKASTFNQAFTQFLGRKSTADIDASTWAWLHQNDPEGQHRLEQMQEAWNSKGARDGDSQQETAGLIRALTDMAEHPDVYKGMSADQFNSRWAPQLSERGWRQVGEKFAALKAQPDKDLALSGQAAKTVTELTSRAFGEATTNPDKWTPQHQELWRYVHDYVEQQSTAWSKQHHGATPSDEQYQKWANDKLVKGKIPGTGLLFDDTRTRVEFERNPKYQGKQFVEEIPKDLEAAIRARFQKRGIKPTDEQLRKAFEAYQAGQGGK